MITGTSREDLNGRAGVATSFEHDHDRYVVELEGNAGGEKEKGKLKLKPGNLALVARKQTKEQGKLSFMQKVRVGSWVCRWTRHGLVGVQV